MPFFPLMMRLLCSHFCVCVCFLFVGCHPQNRVNNSLLLLSLVQVCLLLMIYLCQHFSSFSSLSTFNPGIASPGLILCATLCRHRIQKRREPLEKYHLSLSSSSGIFPHVFLLCLSAHAYVTAEAVAAASVQNVQNILSLPFETIIHRGARGLLNRLWRQRLLLLFIVRASH